MPETTVHYRACNLCEAICGLEIHLEEGRIVSIRGDEADPLSRGHICPKAVALQDLESDPDRLREPLRRGDDGSWQEVEWEAALDEIAARTRRVQAEHGRDAVGVYLGNPNVHNSGSILYLRPFLKALGSRNRFSASSVDQHPHHLAAMLMFGHQFLLPVADVDRTQYLLVLGANPLASNGSMMTAPGMRDRLKALRARGGKLVVVDPRRTETARAADRHLFIEPGTDALFLLSLLHVLFAEGLARPGRLEAFTDGLAELRAIAADYPPERTAVATGIAADDVRVVARELAAAEAAACYGRLGVSVQEFGGLCLWLVNAVNVVTGNLDRPGGAMFPRPAIDMLALTGRGNWGRWKSRVRGLPEFASELPAATLAEEIDVAGPGQIRALFTVAGNPVLSTPNGARLERALPGLELMVSIDPYLNETTRHAHFILPTTPPLQRDHYDVIFHALAVRNTARYSPPLFAPDAGHAARLAGARGARAAARPRPARRPAAAPLRGGARPAAPARPGAAQRRLRSGLPPLRARPDAAAAREGAARRRPRPARALPAGSPAHSRQAHRLGAGAVRGRPDAAAAAPRRDRRGRGGERDGERGQRPRPAAPHRPPPGAEQQLVDAQRRPA